MSRPQGGLEVERYIGSCLISSTLRQNIQKTQIIKKQDNQQLSLRGNPNCYPQNYSPGNEQCQYGTWTGAPLISMTSSPRRSNQRLSPSPCQQIQNQSSTVDQTQQQQQSQQVTGHLQNRSPLSRLAIHTQGAPLILAGRFHNRGKLQNCGNLTTGANVNNFSNTNNNIGNTAMSIGRCGGQRGQRTMETPRKPQQQQQQHHNQQLHQKNDCQPPKPDNSGSNIANIDSLSIASDESSNNSENSLPRIIKPRKRRKKDRKPTNPVSQEISKQDEPIPPTNQVTDHTSLVTLKQYVPVCYEARYEPASHRSHRRPPVVRESYGRTQTSTSIQEITDTRQRYGHRHVQVKVLDDNRNVVLPSNVRAQGITKIYRNHHHINNPVNRCNNNNPTRYINYDTSCEKGVVDDTCCQCRYCDPSGLIWDVEQNCYSPFLTPPPSSSDFGVQYPQMPLYLSRPSLSCPEQDYYDVDDQIHGHHSHHQHHPHHSQSRPNRMEPTGCALLRRSWSDPTSYFSEQISTPSRDVGVIGDRGQAEVTRGRSSWPGSASSGVSPSTNVTGLGSLSNSVTPTQSLEVSTEIVTSLNGHRDLEIKFYSSSPSSAPTEEEKSPFLDDNEDFSDIWSYHESKLQQDFRTLLQAEE
ncbi:myb-like protein M [Diachasma alloeum]|uniref:myb-like protein M n=1 Tax=Diachasma alloeum TaxID=454923 RepID=UPI0010FB41A5|nr:myb-like protein M [Diachasma alloeum]